VDALAERTGSRSTDESLDVIEIGRGGAAAGNPIKAPTLKPADTEGSRVAEKRFRYFWTVLRERASPRAVASAVYPSFELVTHRDVLSCSRWCCSRCASARGPAVVGAVLNVAAFDFFFVPPRFKLRPHRPAALPSPSR